MKMSIFATLARAKLDIESIKAETWWRSGRSVFLRQYMNIEPKLLYKTWTAA